MAALQRRLQPYTTHNREVGGSNPPGAIRGLQVFAYWAEFARRRRKVVNVYRAYKAKRRAQSAINGRTGEMRIRGGRVRAAYNEALHSRAWP